MKVWKEIGFAIHLNTLKNYLNMKAQKKTSEKVEAKSISQGKRGNLESLQAVLIYGLNDVYKAEKKSIDLYEKLSKSTYSAQLRKVYDDHLKVTKNHVKRLEKIFTLIGINPGNGHCQGFDGITEEIENIINNYISSFSRDAYLIAASQKIEHYEIASYGSLIAFAEALDYSEIEELLNESLAEEHKVNFALTEVAESVINIKAAKTFKGELVQA